MKLRLGFVSNSSTSSFVIVGTYFDHNDELIELIEKSNLNIYENIVGVSVSISSDDDYEANELNLDDLKKTIDKVKESVLRLGIDPEGVKIYHTIQMS